MATWETELTERSRHIIDAVEALLTQGEGTAQFVFRRGRYMLTLELREVREAIIQKPRRRKEDNGTETSGPYRQPRPKR